MAITPVLEGTVLISLRRPINSPFTMVRNSIEALPKLCTILSITRHEFPLRLVHTLYYRISRVAFVKLEFRSVFRIHCTPVRTRHVYAVAFNVLQTMTARRKVNRSHALWPLHRRWRKEKRENVEGEVNVHAHTCQASVHLLCDTGVYVRVRMYTYATRWKRIHTRVARNWKQSFQ